MFPGIWPMLSMGFVIKIKRMLKSCISFPFALVWSWVYRLRRFFYDYGILKRYELRTPVISIGNLTFGGSGKTPLTIWIANHIANQGKKPMVLTRGYKGELEKSSGLLDCESRIHVDPKKYGDEPVLMAKKIQKGSVLVGKNRVDNFLFYFERERPDIVVLDDGHQHLKMNRLLNVVMFDLTLPLSEYQVAPLGYMREGFSALMDTHLVVFNRVTPATRYKVHYLKNKMKRFLSPGVQFVEINYQTMGLRKMNRQKDDQDLLQRGVRCLCLSAIASPDSFYTMVEKAGGKVVKKISFPDHHYYNEEDVRLVLDKAKKENAIVVTTEKDSVKLRRIACAESIYYLEIDLEFVGGENYLRDAIQRCL